MWSVLIEQIRCNLLSFLDRPSFLVLSDDATEQRAKLFSVQVLGLKIKRNLNFGEDLLMRFLDLGEEGMRKGFIDGDAEVGVELQHAVDQIDGFWRRTWIFLLEVDSVDRNEALQVTDCLLVGHE